MYCQNKLSKYNAKNTNSIYVIKHKYYEVMSGGMMAVDIKYIKALDLFIKEYNIDAEKRNSQITSESKPFEIIDASHGLEHALVVLCHCKEAIDSWNRTHPENMISDKEQHLVKVAALYHDIDDSKYFPNNTEFENAKGLLEALNVPKDDLNQIIKMISWVSASKNGDNIPDECKKKPWLLYPRYSDRLEALGVIGVERTLDYTLKKQQPLFIPQPPKPNITIDEIYKTIATDERYKSYKGKSLSMIDHFYDKLLRLGSYPINNEYFYFECRKRQKPLEDIAIEFERTGSIEESLVREYIKKNKSISVCCSCNSYASNYISE